MTINFHLSHFYTGQHTHTYIVSSTFFFCRLHVDINDNVTVCTSICLHSHIQLYICVCVYVCPSVLEFYEFRSCAVITMNVLTWGQAAVFMKAEGSVNGHFGWTMPGQRCHTLIADNYLWLSVACSLVGNNNDSEYYVIAWCI